MDALYHADGSCQRGHLGYGWAADPDRSQNSLEPEAVRYLAGNNDPNYGPKIFFRENVKYFILIKINYDQTFFTTRGSSVVPQK
jgi:hypothetical protein